MFENGLDVRTSSATLRSYKHRRARRVVGEVDDLVDKAKELGQRTMFGTGFARFLKSVLK